MACGREDTFLKEHLGMVAVAASQAVQLEVDRFSLATSLLAVAAKAHWGQPATLSAPSPPHVLGTDPPEAIRSKFEKSVSTPCAGNAALCSMTFASIARRGSIARCHDMSLQT